MRMSTFLRKSIFELDLVALFRRLQTRERDSERRSYGDELCRRSCWNCDQASRLGLQRTCDACTRFSAAVLRSFVSSCDRPWSSCSGGGSGVGS
ncbi:hypothetical protein KC19_4G094500 [Ceratodon purpureus]|uniref:Uncharacterized protein n=1 Tax=Ceratodon purpureus TaxID=3225 RepID=A0A8T0I9F4_CERPU|nr:hypothetical protein KC19_4G094500 [Ceratodon purpureus]